MRKKSVKILTTGLVVSLCAAAAVAAGLIVKHSPAYADGNNACGNSAVTCIRTDADVNNVCGNNYVDEDGDGVCDNRGTCQDHGNCNNQVSHGHHGNNGHHSGHGNGGCGTGGCGR